MNRINAAINVYNEYIGTIESQEDIQQVGKDEFVIDGRTILVLTEDESLVRATEIIKDSISHFKPEYLANETGLPEETFEELKGKDDAVLKIIESQMKLTEFIKDVVKHEGYGPFISSYDGEQYEYGDYFVYQLD